MTAEPSSKALLSPRGPGVRARFTSSVTPPSHARDVYPQSHSKPTRFSGTCNRNALTDLLQRGAPPARLRRGREGAGSSWRGAGPWSNLEFGSTFHSAATVGSARRPPHHEQLRQAKGRASPRVREAAPRCPRGASAEEVSRTCSISGVSTSCQQPRPNY